MYRSAKPLRRCWPNQRMVLSSPSRALVVIALFSLVLWSFLRSLPIWPTKIVPVGPLTQERLRNGGIGGTWYIPLSWKPQISSAARVLNSRSTVVEAAEYSLELAVHQRAFLNNSHIPLIVHQKWSLDPATWPNVVREGLEPWICMAVQNDGDCPSGPQMAWFLWDDAGMDAFIKQYEPKLYADFQKLPYIVEKVDVFRVAVLKWFGGIWADVDTEPLKHPYEWIYNSDIIPWSNAQAHHRLHQPASPAYTYPGGGSTSYETMFSSISASSSLSQPSVNALFGIEADITPDSGMSPWRMGYTYAVQITNWALAMSPHHPVADEYIHAFEHSVAGTRKDLLRVDPVDITGPPALTSAIKQVAQRDDPHLSWDTLSARNDLPGGRGKIVGGDMMILPITGFSPGRGTLQNMGSMSTTHENARLQHKAAGTWRKTSFKVHYGKLCRLLFGMCKDWSKVA